MKESVKFYIGTSGWTYNSWAGGKFYPTNCRKEDWFDYYSHLFNSVEINATFYRFFTQKTYEKWRKQAPKNFHYAVKAPQLITHRKYLKDVKHIAENFMQSALTLKQHLGLILLQLSPRTPYDLDRLHQALLAFKHPKKLAVEFRHSQWRNDDVLNLLKTLGVTYCNVDSPECELTEHLTSDIAYIRLHGRRHWFNYNYSKNELQTFATIAQNLATQGAKQIYIYFNNDIDAHAPHNAIQLQKLL